MGAEKTDFKIGDVVTLSAGGQTMTVRKVDDVEVLCQWFVGGELNSTTFPSTMLNHAPQKTEVLNART